MDSKKNFEKRFAKLNSAQAEAVSQIFGPVMVLAGPGSGKTELLGLRVANILRTTDALAESILCLTFTDSAAANLRKRLVSMIGSEAYRVNIFTFHSLGVQIIQDYPEYFFDELDFQPMDDIAQIQVMDKILSRLSLTKVLAKYSDQHGWIYQKDILDRINLLKKEGITPSEFEQYTNNLDILLTRLEPLIQGFLQLDSRKASSLEITNLVNDLSELQTELKPEMDTSYISLLLEELLVLQSIEDKKELSKEVTQFKKKWSKGSKKDKTLADISILPKLKELAEVYKLYQMEIFKQQKFDFADMLMEVLLAVAKYPDLASELQEKYQFVMVDEFQDTSGLQLKFLYQFLTGQEKPNILIVGDDDQAIYKFQGANTTNFLEFYDKYPQSKVISLSINYRSNSEILEYARRVIADNPLSVAKKLGFTKEITSYQDLNLGS